jgi:hypothetical protein
LNLENLATPASFIASDLSVTAARRKRLAGEGYAGKAWPGDVFFMPN